MQKTLERSDKSALNMMLNTILATELLQSNHHKLSQYIFDYKIYIYNDLHSVKYQIDYIITRSRERINTCEMGSENDYLFQKELARQMLSLMNISSYVDRICEGKNKNKNKRLISKKKFRSSTHTLLQHVQLIELSINNLLLSKGGSRIFASLIRQQNEHFLDKNEINFFLRVKTSIISLFRRVIHHSSTANKIVFGLVLSIPTYIATLFLIGVVVNATLPEFVKYINETTLIVPREEKEEDKIVLHASEAIKNRDNNVLAKTRHIFLRLIYLTALAIISGSLGSITSILTRLNEYKDEEKNYEGNALPVTIGFVKPLIGGFLGLFIFCLFNSSLSPGDIMVPISSSENEVQEAEENNHPLTDDEIELRYIYNIFVICFVAGFSERWAKDIISQVK